MSSLTQPSSIVLAIGAVCIFLFVIHGLWFPSKPQNRKLKKNNQQDQALSKDRKQGKVRIIEPDLPDDEDEEENSELTIKHKGNSSYQSSAKKRMSLIEEEEDAITASISVNSKQSTETISKEKVVYSPSEALAQANVNVNVSPNNQAFMQAQQAGANPSLFNTNLGLNAQASANGMMQGNVNGMPAPMNGAGTNFAQNQSGLNSFNMANAGAAGATNTADSMANTGTVNAPNLQTGDANTAMLYQQGMVNPNAANAAMAQGAASGANGNYVAMSLPENRVYEICVIAAPDAPFTGESISEICNRFGFAEGFINESFKIYSVYEKNDDKTSEVFRICSIDKPYYFPLDMSNFTTSGIVLYMQVPPVGKGLPYFKALRLATEIFVESLGGSLQDQKHNPIDSTTLDRYAQELMYYDQQGLESGVAGSNANPS